MMAACVLAVSASGFQAAYALNNKVVVGAARKTWDKAAADRNKESERAETSGIPTGLPRPRQSFSASLAKIYDGALASGRQMV